MSEKGSGQRRESWKAAIFNKMTEGEAVTKAEENVRGRQNQVSQKPREQLPGADSDHHCQRQSRLRGPTEWRNEKRTCGLSIRTPETRKLVRLLGCGERNPLQSL